MHGGRPLVGTAAIPQVVTPTEIPARSAGWAG
ncbi:hypothetical protein FHS32_003510 [Streptomyces albaduncus]|uniref:Uncharacterized protein n=1 Tax=Streptomyces griseoloalbus TaxID=67303 RepID=A0A7W8FA00_9ACTN|nr:hypothetical protein [Streptomyces albaduncus]